jgi:hypothetical protein
MRNDRYVELTFGFKIKGTDRAAKPLGMTELTESTETIEVIDPWQLVPDCVTGG